MDCETTQHCDIRPKYDPSAERYTLYPHTRCRCGEEKMKRTRVAGDRLSLFLLRLRSLHSSGGGGGGGVKCLNPTQLLQNNGLDRLHLGLALRIS